MRVRTGLTALRAAATESALQLRLWKGGIALQARTDPPVTASLGFCEWNLFDAFEKGGHLFRGTRGDCLRRFERDFPTDAAEAS